MGLLLLLIILLLVFGSGGFYVAQPGYSGPGAGMHSLLYILCFIVVIVIVLNLLGVY